MKLDSKKIKYIISAIVFIIAIIGAITGKDLLSGSNNDNDDNNKTTTTAVVTQAETEKSTTSAKTTTAEKTTSAKVTTTAKPTEAPAAQEYHFRRKSDLTSHFDKHGKEFRGDFNYKTAADYEKGASDVINNPDALYKTEKEDGDHVYYIEETNEFVVLSRDGYIRTYFRPTRGIDYFHDQ